MIIGIGTDIVDIQRIEKTVQRFGERFLNKIFTEEETLIFNGKKDRAPYLASRFAAKEAVLKAFGTGVSGGIGLKDVEITREPGKKPEVLLHGKLKKMAESLGVKCVHLSISHDAGIAVAFAVVEI